MPMTTEYAREYMRKWREKNRDKYRKYQREYQAKYYYGVDEGMKEELLAEFERSLSELKAMPKENGIGIKQMKSHIRNVRNKLRAINCGREAYEMERKHKWQNK